MRQTQRRPGARAAEGRGTAPRTPFSGEAEGYRRWRAVTVLKGGARACPAVRAEPAERPRADRIPALPAAMSREPEIMEARVMWEPDSKRNTHMDRFRAALACAYGLRLGERGGGRPGRAGALPPHRIQMTPCRVWGHNRRRVDVARIFGQNRC